jgi:hypothetical protein
MTTKLTKELRRNGYYPDNFVGPVAAWRGAELALQQKLGLLPEWPAGSGSSCGYHTRDNRPPMKYLALAIVE